MGAASRKRGGQPPPLSPHHAGARLSGSLLADLLATAAPAAAQGTPGAPQTFTPTRGGVGRSCACCSGRRPRS